MAEPGGGGCGRTRVDVVWGGELVVVLEEGV